MNMSRVTSKAIEYLPITGLSFVCKPSNSNKAHGVEKEQAPVLAISRNCIKSLLCKFFDIVCAYGVTDDYSFVFHESTEFFKRRASKLVSLVVSFFTSAYVTSWPHFLPEKKLIWAPVFTGSIYCYKLDSSVRSFLSSRQHNWMCMQGQNSMGNFLFKIKDEKGTKIVDRDFNITKVAFWNEYSHILQKKMSKRSLIKAWRKGLKPTGPLIKDQDLEDNVDMEFKFDISLPSNEWTVVRIDGWGFKKFCAKHGFEKPNDAKGLQLMNECGKAVLYDNPNIVCAYGVSDEYSFVIDKSAPQQLSMELISTTVSIFTSSFALNWSKFFPEKELKYAPAFDARAVSYPTNAILKDYLSWRQVDCHINNVNNTCFWKYVESSCEKSLKETYREAHQKLKGTTSVEKQMFLMKNFNIVYRDLPAEFRKGSFLKFDGVSGEVSIIHCNIIDDEFWEEHRETLKL